MGSDSDNGLDHGIKRDHRPDWNDGLDWIDDEFRQPHNRHSDLGREHERFTADDEPDRE